ncbi:hypothetical protein BJY52DRAFT_1121674, partial [Lactarius psammicola]
VLRTISHSLPEALYGRIQTVVRTTYFGPPLTEGMRPQMRPSAAVEAREKSREEYDVTPSYLRGLYKITVSYVPAAADQSMPGIGGYVAQHLSLQDLRTFMEECRTDGADATYTVEQINGGGYSPRKRSIEGNSTFDTQRIAYRTQHIYYSTSGKPHSLTDDPYIRWLRHVIALADNQHNMPPNYMVSVCRLFAQLGAPGVSTLFASGDWAVGHGDCSVRDSSGHPSAQFFPAFPTNFHSPDRHAFVGPWFTSVGGTESDSPEFAASFSGGGFSGYFLR